MRSLISGPQAPKWCLPRGLLYLFLGLDDVCPSIFQSATVAISSQGMPTLGMVYSYLRWGRVLFLSFKSLCERSPIVTSKLFIPGFTLQMGSAEGSFVGSSWPEPLSPLPLPRASRESYGVFHTTQDAAEAKAELLQS